MGDDSFFRTRMGHRFFESTMPQIADELGRLNRNMEALVALLERRGGGAPPDDACAQTANETQPSAQPAAPRR